MHLLAENFLIFSFCGCWMPDKAVNSKCKSTIYVFYRLIIFSNNLCLILFKIINISQGFSNIRELASVTLGLADFTCAAVKSITVYNKREQLLEIDRQFVYCKRKNDSKEKMKIQMGFDKTCRFEIVYI